MPTVLVADDNSNIQKMVVLALEDQGITVVAVSNGEAAVRKMPNLLPDIILADIFMPVRNGYEVCEFVKNDSRLAHIPVVLLIGAFDPLDEKEVRRVGANGVLKKPFVPPDPLIAMVTGFLAGIAKQQGSKPAPAEAVEVAESRLASIPMPSPASESGPEEFAVAPGPLSLREEQREAEEASSLVETAQQGRDETAGDWQRRTGLSLEIPADLAPTSFGSETEIADDSTQVSPIPFEPFMREHKGASVEDAFTPPATESASEWEETISAPAQSFKAEPLDGFVAEAEPEAAAPSSEISSDAPPEILWQPAVLAAQRAHVQEVTEPEATLREELAPAYEPPPEEMPYTPEPVAYEVPRYFPAPFLMHPNDSFALPVYPLEELPPEAAEPEPFAAPSPAQVLSFPTPLMVDPATVDAVVAKVLERLEPQIRDILSRELVRPLTEAFLQRENEKK